jgi:hypothetical protein
MSSKRQTALETVFTRLQAIKRASGYQTDAGLATYFGESPQLGPDDPDEAVAMVVGEDAVGYQGPKVVTRVPIQIQAIAKADLEQPWATIEAVIADVKKAVELADSVPGGNGALKIERGSTRPLDREPGSTTVGASITYTAQIHEAWGAP